MLNSNKRIAVFGFMGVFVLIFGMLVTAVCYRGRTGLRYRPVNHFVSELGELGVSKLAAVFNISVILGGICITLFILGLSALFKNWFRFLLSLSGMMTGLSATLVGVFPMNNLQPHIKVAMLFFNSGLFTMAIFSIYVAFSTTNELPRWLLIPGALSTLCFILFLNIPTPSGSDGDSILYIQRRLIEDRPAIWPLAITEWVVIIAVLAWVLIVSGYLYKSRHELKG